MRIMKFTTLIILCTTIIFCCGCDARNSQNYEVTPLDTDARLIPTDVRELIADCYEENYCEPPDFENEIWLRVYNSVLLFRMCDYDSTQVWLRDNSHRIAYISITGDENDHKDGRCWWIENETLESGQIAYPYNYHSWNIFYQYVMKPELLFGTEVQVYAVYCIVGGSVHDGDSVYYVTDRGDYVLHKLLPYFEEVYLVPVETLREMYNQLERPVPGQMGTWYAFTALPGIEQYIIDLDNPPEFPPLPAVEEDRNGLPWQWILPGGAVLILGTVAAIYLWHKKKKV